MPEQLLFTRLLNEAFAGPITALRNALQGTLHIPVAPKYPDAPIPNFVAMEVLVFAFLIVVFLVVRSQLSVESPAVCSTCLRVFTDSWKARAATLLDITAN